MAKHLLMTKFGIGAYAPPAPVPKMPPGLVELMEELSRDVLRNNPPEEELHLFCANHMRKLLNIRGASEGKKPLSLENKIKRAQERVRQKSEQHRRKFDEYLKQLPLFTDGNEGEPSDSKQPEPSNTKDIEEKNCEDISNVLELAKAKNTETNVPELFDTKEQEINDSKESVKVGEEIPEESKTSVEEKSDSIDKKNISETETRELIDDEKKNTPESVSEENDEHTKTVANDNMEDAEQPMVNVENDKVEVLEIHTENHPDAKLDCENANDTEKKISDADSTSELQEIAPPNTEDVTTDTNTNVEVIQDSVDKIANAVTDNIVVADNNVKQNIVLEKSIEVESIKPAKDEFKEETVAVEDKNMTAILETADSKAINIFESDPEAGNVNDDDEKIVETVITEPLRSEQTFIIDGSKHDDNNEEENKSTAIIAVPIRSGVPVSENVRPIRIPGIIDEDSLKENEVSIVTKSNSNDQETSLISMNNYEHSLLLSDDKDSADKIDIDINAIARSDSVKEEGNENVSDSNTVNDVEDLNHPGMDLETAAITIQKVFRTFMFKSRANTLDDAISNEDGSLDASFPRGDMCVNEGENLLKSEDEYHASNMKERRPLGITRMDTVLQTVNEEKSLSLSDDSSMSSAATIIQAHVRGFLVRNKLHSSKTTSLNSLVNSEGNSTSVEIDNEPKNKTVLNIHIVPEGGHYISRDESMAMSLDLPYDHSPPSWGPSQSLNLHPLSERRKQLKREDAIQSISPPSNNSGKLSEDVESLKDVSVNGVEVATNADKSTVETLVDDKNDKELENPDNEPASGETTPTKSFTVDTVIQVLKDTEQIATNPTALEIKSTLTKSHLDESDVVTKDEYSDKAQSVDSDNTSRLLHSGEFHDLVLPTSVMRADSTVVREFKNVVVKYLLWNSSS